DGGTDWRYRCAGPRADLSLAIACRAEEPVRLSFEPEIVFPDQPFEAAFVYFGAMAYPEQGAGTEGRPGSEFANALAKFSIWSCCKARGLRYLREQYGDPSAVAPQKREFQGAFERGMRRVERRIAAYDLIGTQILR